MVVNSYFNSCYRDNLFRRNYTSKIYFHELQNKKFPQQSTGAQRPFFINSCTRKYFSKLFQQQKRFLSSYSNNSFLYSAAIVIIFFLRNYRRFVFHELYDQIYFSIFYWNKISFLSIATATKYFLNCFSSKNIFLAAIVTKRFFFNNYNNNICSQELHEKAPSTEINVFLNNLQE